MSEASPSTPKAVRLHRKRRVLELVYSDQSSVELDAEYLRVFSPSAEVRGHGPGQETLQCGKKHVALERVAAVGNYAVQLYFDDGHDSGIYSWGYLYELAQRHAENWAEYQHQLAEAGKSRDPSVQVLKL